MAQHKVLVTGATGAVGPALVRHLVGEGYIVRTLTRQPAGNDLLPDDVEIFLGDITDAQAVKNAVADVDAILHLAAKLHIENPSPELEKEYERINVGGTKTLVDAALSASVKRFVYFSTVKVYGEKASTPIDETQIPQPETMYAQTKLQGEKIVTDAPIDSVILRLSAVYGARLRGSWARLASAIKRGMFLPIGNLKNKRSITYVDDVALAAQIAIEHPNIIVQKFNVVGQESVTMREIYHAIYSAYNRTMPSITLRAMPLIVGVQLADIALSLVERRAPINAESLKQLVIDEMYSGQALRGYGFTPKTSLQEGWLKIAQSQNEVQT